MSEDIDIDDNKRSAQELETYNILKTREEIENEFKNLKFLHQHEEKDNVDTIFNETRLNGSFENTYVLRQKDDTFIFFPYEVYIVKNLKDFWSFYDSHKDTTNILIDSRLINYIAFGVIKYGEDLLIYDSYSSKIKSIYFFCSDYFHIQTNELTISQIKQLFFMYLLILVFSKQLNISWDVYRLIKCIKTNDYNIYFEHNPNIDIFDMVINYIKIQSQTNINSNNIKKIVNYFDSVFSRDAYSTETAPEIKEWNLENITSYEFYIAIIILKNNNFHIYNLH